MKTFRVTYDYCNSSLCNSNEGKIWNASMDTFSEDDTTEPTPVEPTTMVSTTTVPFNTKSITASLPNTTTTSKVEVSVTENLYPDTTPISAAVAELVSSSGVAGELLIYLNDRLD